MTRPINPDGKSESQQIREMWDHLLSVSQQVHQLNYQMTIALKTIEWLSVNTIRLNSLYNPPSN